MFSGSCAIRSVYVARSGFYYVTPFLIRTKMCTYFVTHVQNFWEETYTLFVLNYFQQYT
jgi:hypothetical protein